ncbi:hypothetical protein CTI12_AA312850 [Artemisia annua]|uniref:Uncharacterized protein n=1 Tax=Artemisia annua TaxID=35608 RepID=A0A2U1N3H0_ARTAN|nr:hypothetical protein CTI12_AA312850 [Artemisia annua]
MSNLACGHAQLLEGYVCACELRGFYLVHVEEALHTKTSELVMTDVINTRAAEKNKGRRPTPTDGSSSVIESRLSFT